MRVCILGSAAGGGFPQWNCGCPNCVEVRSGSSRVKPRTQDTVAVSADGDAWFLLNASPDIRAQIERYSPLHPSGPRSSPIRAIVLTNGDLDHCLGLFSLRESYPLAIYATDAVRRGLTEKNVLFRTLNRFPGQITWRLLEPGRSVDLAGPDGEESGLKLVARPVPGKLPVHLVGISTPSPEDNIGVWIHDTRTGKQLAYMSSVGALGPFTSHLGEADGVLFDGTFWSSDEMVSLGLSKARAEDMAHLPVGGKGGSLDGLKALRTPVRIFTHINNTNPLLLEGSSEHRAALGAGWLVARDGMELEL